MVVSMKAYLCVCGEMKHCQNNLLGCVCALLRVWL